MYKNLHLFIKSKLTRNERLAVGWSSKVKPQKDKKMALGSERKFTTNGRFEILQ